jgi:hypothetical protein
MTLITLGVADSTAVRHLLGNLGGGCRDRVSDH